MYYKPKQRILKVVKEQRQLEILKILNKDGHSTIAALATELEVSQSTVRRDLNELSRKDLVAFKRDSVVPLSQDIIDKPMDYRAAVNPRPKAILAKAAIKLITDGSCVFLDSSSTVLAMVPTLRTFKNIIVVTNSLSAVRQLRDASFPVHFIGGELSPRSLATFGPHTDNSLREYNFDFGFFSPVAITENNYVAETSENAAIVRRTALEQTQCAVLLCDHTKIGLSRPYNVAHLDAFDYLFTDDTKHAFETRAIVRRIKD